MEPSLNTFGIKQLGFVVPDLEQAARRYVEAFGCGPFLDMGQASPKKATYRGGEANVKIRCALGYHRGVQIELIEPLSGELDIYTETGRYGLHHICMWTDDLKATVDDMQRKGYEVAFEQVSEGGMHVVYFDALDTWGVFIECNEPATRLWDVVKQIAENGEPGTCLIPLSALMHKE